MSYTRLAVGLVAYWLLATVGAGLLVRSGMDERNAATWIIISMLATVIVCMATERGQWKAWHRIGYVVLAWLGQPILTAAIFFTVGRLGFIDLDLLYRFLYFTASLPFVIFAMWRSRLFAKVPTLGP